MIGPGAKPPLFFAAQCLLQPGDEILIPVRSHSQSSDELFMTAAAHTRDARWLRGAHRTRASRCTRPSRRLAAARTNSCRGTSAPLTSLCSVRAELLHNTAPNGSASTAAAGGHGTDSVPASAFLHGRGGAERQDPHCDHQLAFQPDRR